MAPRSRIDLQKLLESILGSKNVYFQPPASVRMSYPCIVYSTEKIDSIFANDKPYDYDIRYEVTVIDRNPDSDIPRRLLKLPKCVHSRSYPADELNHTVFNLYF